MRGDCYDAFREKSPRLCRFALANHMWLGRWPPILRDANLSHQMLLALARIVTTKVVLRPEGRTPTKSEDGTPAWDFLFHQSGMVGPAVLLARLHARKRWRNSRRSAFKVSLP